MKNSVKIVGIKSAPSSKYPEVTYFTYFYTSAFSDYELNHADCYGELVGSEFCREDLGCKVGDEIEFIYRKGFAGKAEVCGCTVIKPHIK